MMQLSPETPKHRNPARVAPRMPIMAPALLAVAIVIGAPNMFGAAMAEEVTAEDTINALNGVFGRHAKQRSSHAKGFCSAGAFTPSKEGSSFTNTSLFAGAKVPVTARFSTGGGNPKASDTKRAVRGIGLRFHLPNDEELDLVMTNAPAFFASTPAQFVEYLKVRTKDAKTGKKDKAKIKAWNAANPNVMTHINYMSKTPPPASYATAPYFSAHAFLFENSQKAENAARWSVEPVGGILGLTKDQEETFPKNFLKQEMAKRLSQGPALWDIFLQIGEEGDSLVDPTSLWPETRKKINVGRLELNRMIEKEAADDCTGFVFDPNNLPSGISATDDPILAIRSAAYSVSLSRREE